MGKNTPDNPHRYTKTLKMNVVLPVVFALRKFYEMKFIATILNPKKLPFLECLNTFLMKRLAVLLPWFSFFLREKYVQGYICLALQITIIGWPVAATWALFTLVGRKKAVKEEYVIRSLRPRYAA